MKHIVLILLIATAALASFLNCRIDTITAPMPEPVDTSCASQRSWALYKFKAGDFQFPKTRQYRHDYYFEEAFYVLFRVKASVPLITSCILGDDEDPTCYDYTIDSLISDTYGRSALDRAQYYADSLYKTDPQRYGNECFYSPTYIPNNDSMYAHLRKFVHYPATAKQDSVTGVVYVRLEIDSLGNVKNASVARGVRHDLDSAACAGAAQLGAFRTVLRWGMKEGGYVNIPVRFTLED